MASSINSGSVTKGAAILLTAALGYSGYVPGTISATKEFYLFEYKDGSGNITEAFACFCQKRSNGTSYWQGSGSSTCNTPNSGAKAIPPNSILIPSAYRLSISTMPSGACCLSQPKDANGNIPGLPVPVPGNDNCFF